MGEPLGEREGGGTSPRAHGGGKTREPAVRGEREGQVEGSGISLRARHPGEPGRGGAGGDE